MGFPFFLSIAGLGRTPHLNASVKERGVSGQYSRILGSDKDDPPLRAKRSIGPAIGKSSQQPVSFSRLPAERGLEKEVV